MQLGRRDLVRAIFGFLALPGSGFVSACSGRGTRVTTADYVEVRVGDGETDASDFAWFPDGRAVAVLATMMRKVTVVDLATGTRRAELDHTGSVSTPAIAVLPDGRVVCGPDEHHDSAATIWNPADGSNLQLPGPAAGTRVQNVPGFGEFAGRDLQRFAVDRSGKRLLGNYQSPAAGGFSLALYDLASPGPPVTSAISTNILALSPDGKQAAVLTRRAGQVSILDIDGGFRPVSQFQANRNDVVAMAWGADSRLLATGSFGQGFGLDPATGKYGPRLDSDLLQLWDTATGQRVAVVNGSNGIESLDFSSDGRWLAAAFTNGLVRLFGARDLSPGPVVMPPPATMDEAFDRVRFSPNSRLLGAMSQKQRALRIFDMARLAAGRAG